MLRAPVLIFMICLFVVARTASTDTASPLVGARATGLAGAFTAVADDSTAFHWNPAGIVYGSLIRAGFYAGTSFQDRNELVNGVRQELPGDRSVLDGYDGIGFSTSFTMLGVAVTGLTETSSLLKDGMLHSGGLEALDVAVTLAQSLPLDELTVGVNARFIRGTAFEHGEPASFVPPASRNVGDLGDRATAGEGRTENEFGLDLGLLYQPNEWLRLGLMARNLTEPTFHTESDNEIVLPRHARAGVAFMLESDFLVAVDADLTSRDSSRFLPASAKLSSTGSGSVVHWRELSVGVEKAWGNRRVALRGGLRTEIAGGSLERPGVSLGVGVRIAMVIVDLGVISSTQRQQGALWVGVSLSR